MIKINDRPVHGIKAFFLGLVILVYIGIIFISVAVVLLIPVWLLILFGFAIAKVLG